MQVGTGHGQIKKQALTYRLPVQVFGRRRGRRGLRWRALDRSGFHGRSALGGGVEGAGGGRDDAVEAEVLDGDAVCAAVEEELCVAAGGDADAAQVCAGAGSVARHGGCLRACELASGCRRLSGAREMREREEEETAGFGGKNWDPLAPK